MTRLVASCLLVLVPLTVAAGDWPHWLGPTRDGVWGDAGLPNTFAPSGPKKLWSVPAMGGYAGPAVVGGKVFVHEYERQAGDPIHDPNVRAALAGTERVRCLDADTGKELWKHEYPCSYAISYPCGPRCTPTVDGDRVYTLGAMGHLCCLSTKTGKLHWKADFAADLKAPVPVWGFAAHPLIHEEAVVCMVGGPDGAVMAFDKFTGKVTWKALPGADAGYCPPSAQVVNGKPQLIVWHPKALVGLAPDSGKPQWEVKLEPMYGMSVAAPQRHGDHLFAGGIGGHAVMLKFEKEKAAPAELWRGEKDTAVYPTNSTPILHDGILYGCDSATGGLRAVDVATGKRLWETFAPTTGKDAAKHGTAFLTRNGDRFYLMSETGELVLARLTREKYEELGRAKLIEPTGHAFGRAVAWSPPAFANGRVYIRNDKCVTCYDLTAK